MSFDGIPEEIAEQILLCLVPRDRGPWDNKMSKDDVVRQTALSRAARTCKRLHRIGLPILYGTIPITSSKFLLTIAGNASLASLVKSIDFLPSIKETSDLREALDIATSRLSIPPEVTQWLYQRFGLTSSFLCDNAEALLHLMLLPNLERVANLDPWMLNHDTVLDFFKESGSFSNVQLNDGSPPFSVFKPPKLLSLRLEHTDDEGTSHVYSIQDLLKPRVQELHAIALAWYVPDFVDPDNTEDFATPMRLSQRLGLRDITLWEADVDASGVEDMLKRCPNLRSLTIQWGDLKRGESRLDFEWMGNAIRRYGTGLEDLYLDFRYSFAYNEGEDEMDGKIDYVPLEEGEYWLQGRLGSLRELVKLKSLGLQQEVMLWSQTATDDNHGNEEVLMLDQCLPDSLERLYLLTRYEGDLDHEVCELFKSEIRQKTLRHIHLHASKDLFTNERLPIGSRAEEFMEDVKALGFKAALQDAHAVFRKMA